MDNYETEFSLTQGQIEKVIKHFSKGAGLASL